MSTMRKYTVAQMYHCYIATCLAATWLQDEGVIFAEINPLGCLMELVVLSREFKSDWWPLLTAGSQVAKSRGEGAIGSQ